MTLYELKQEYMELLAMLEDPDVDPEVVNDTLEAVSGELTDKCESYTVIIKELEGELYKQQAERDRWSRSCATLDENIKRMKQAVVDTIKLTGERKMATEHFKLSIVRNGGKQPMEVDENVPKEYIRIIEQPDTYKIRQALESGETLDFARLKERGEHLGIK